MAPFASEAQRRYLFVHEPQLAQKWAHDYGTPKNLPYHKASPKQKVTAALLARRRGL